MTMALQAVWGALTGFCLGTPCAIVPTLPYTCRCIAASPFLSLAVSKVTFSP